LQTIERTTGRSAAAIGMAAVLLALAAPPSRAQLRLDITQGVSDAVPIAIVPFGGQADGGPADVAAVVASDLERSGRFAPLARQDMVTRPVRGEQIRFEDWRLLKSDFIVVGEVEPAAGNSNLRFELFNVATGQQLLAKQLPSTEAGVRATAHRISDLIFERLTGVRGAFSTRIAYVAVDGTPPAQRYKLIVSDADGFNPRTVADSPEPLMSPAWSPDGRMLAYVSFEGKASAIYVQELASGKRSRVSARAGINGAPAWSPDGKRLALTLSRGGNLDIYTLDLATQTLTRLTSDEAIDTEPEWSRDGGNVYFTSDRPGSPQVYRVPANEGGQAERMTYTGGYNARPRVSPDGEELAMVTLDRGNYRIAAMNLKTRALRVLSTASQDESPSYAPNGATLIYATTDGRGGALATVSSDGRSQQRLSADRGELREPAWSPFPSR
jgi:TolB protein